MKNLNAKPQERFKQELTIKSYFKGWQTGWLNYDEWSKVDTDAPEFMRVIYSGVEARASLLLAQDELEPSIKATARRILELLAKLDRGGFALTDLIALGTLIQKTDTQLAAAGALETMMQLKQLQPAIERGENVHGGSSKGGNEKNREHQEMRKHYQLLINQFYKANPDKSYEWLKSRVQRELKEQFSFKVSTDTIKKYTKNPHTKS